MTLLASFVTEQDAGLFNLNPTGTTDGGCMSQVC